MKTYTILQDAAGRYEIDTDSSDEAINEMARNIVDTTEEWQLQYNTDNYEEAVEAAKETLTIING